MSFDGLFLLVTRILYIASRVADWRGNIQRLGSISPIIADVQAQIAVVPRHNRSPRHALPKSLNFGNVLSFEITKRLRSSDRFHFDWDLAEAALGIEMVAWGRS